MLRYSYCMDFFYYLVMCKCMSTTVRVNGTVQFTFFLIMRLNVTIVSSCALLTVILLPNTCVTKAWKWTEETILKRRWNKIWIWQICCGFSTFYKMRLCGSLSDAIIWFWRTLFHEFMRKEGSCQYYLVIITPKNI